VREVVAASLPAAVCVTSDIATPRICAMKDILAAGKKPVTVWTCADLGCMPKPGIEVQATWVPKPADRKNIVYDASVDGDVDKFIAAIASELGI
jgi:electron transfer flavoprotein beta subunit